MRKTVFAAALFLALPLSAQDGERLTYKDDEPLPVAMTYCIPGESCLTCESEMPLAMVNELLEIKLKDVEVLLFTPDPERPDSPEWKWTATGEIFPAVVEHRLSGTAVREQPPACAHRAALKGSIQPRDGDWMSTPSPVTFKNCPGMEAPAKGAPAQRVTGDFDKPFRGRLSPEESMASIVQVAPNLFLNLERVDGLVGETLLEVRSPNWIKVYFNTRSADGSNPCEQSFSLDLQYIDEG